MLVCALFIDLFNTTVQYMLPGLGFDSCLIKAIGENGIIGPISDPVLYEGPDLGQIRMPPSVGCLARDSQIHSLLNMTDTQQR